MKILVKGKLTNNFKGKDKMDCSEMLSEELTEEEREEFFQAIYGKVKEKKEENESNNIDAPIK